MQRKRARMLAPTAPVNFSPKRKPRENPAKRPRPAKRSQKVDLSPLSESMMVNEPTNSNESNKAKEKAIGHSVAFDKDKDDVEQHLCVHKRVVVVLFPTHQNNCQGQ